MGYAHEIEEGEDRQEALSAESGPREPQLYSLKALFLLQTLSLLFLTLTWASVL